MKLKEFKCENCGAKLPNFEENVKKIKCEFCGSIYKVEKEEHEKENNKKIEKEIEIKYKEIEGEKIPYIVKVFLWIFFFPIMFTIHIIRSNLNKGMKGVILLFFWLIVIGMMS